MSTEKQCYINYSDGRGWIIADKHIQDAFLSFVNTPYNINDKYTKIEISILQDNGEEFVGYFSYGLGYDPQKKYLVNYCGFNDENGRYISLMYCDPIYARFSNLPLRTRFAIYRELNI